MERQIDLIEDGGRVVQETRLYDSELNETRSMRSKEVANDYRYFPEPDLLPVVIDDDYIAAVQATMPELPNAKRARFVSEHGLSDYDAGVLTADRAMAEYFETVVTTCGDAKLAANWVSVDLLGLLNKADKGIAESPVSPEQLGTLIARIKDNTISGKIAKTVFEAMAEGEGDVDQIIENKGLKQVTDTGALESLVDEVITSNPDQVEQFRSGKEQVFGYLVGQAMKLSKGKANPGQVNKLLREKLNNG